LQKCPNHTVITKLKTYVKTYNNDMDQFKCSIITKDQCLKYDERSYYKMIGDN